MIIHYLYINEFAKFVLCWLIMAITCMQKGACANVSIFIEYFAYAWFTFYKIKLWEFQSKSIIILGLFEILYNPLWLQEPMVRGYLGYRCYCISNIRWCGNISTRIPSQVGSLTALLYCVCRLYRSVEVALAVHGDVQPCLGALDGNYSEPHRNQVELHCKK